MRSLLPLFPILVILLGIFGSLVLLGVLREKIGEETNQSNSGDPLNLATVAAQSDLARKLGVRADEILVVSSQVVDWPDASLGCPQPGAVYAQVVTPGFSLLLESAGKLFEYHTGEAESATETPIVDCTDHPAPSRGTPRESV